MAGISAFDDFNRILLGGAKNENRSRTYLFGPQANAYGQFFPYTTQLLQQVQDDPGQFVAGFTPYQIQGQQAAAQAAGGVLPQLAGSAANVYQQGLQSLLPGSEQFNASLQATLNPFIRNFQQTILPAIRSQAVGVGQVGSSRQGIAEGLATQGLLNTLGEQSALFGNRTLSQVPGYLSQIGNVANAQLMPSQALMNIGAQQQALEQARLNAPFMYGSQIRNMIGSPINLNEAYGYGVNSRGITQGGNDLSQGFGQVMGGASAFFSSRELKEAKGAVDPRSVMDAIRDLDIEKWSYKWEDIEHIGPYAEDFANRFGVGDGETISVIDMMGVMLAAIKAADSEIRKLREAIDANHE